MVWQCPWIGGGLDGVERERRSSLRTHSAFRSDQRLWARLVTLGLVNWLSHIKLQQRIKPINWLFFIFRYVIDFISNQKSCEFISLNFCFSNPKSWLMSSFKIGRHLCDLVTEVF